MGVFPQGPSHNDEIEEIFTDGTGIMPPRQRLVTMSCALTDPFITWVKVNPKSAQNYACTHYAMHTFFGDITHTQLVVLMLGIVRGQHIPVYNRESKSPQKLGYALRLAAGFPRDEPKKKKNSSEPPDAIVYQIDKVPRSMLGAGFQNMPKEVTLAFLCGTGAIELDIEASHQQAILLRYPHMKLPTLEKLVQDPRAFRSAIAARTGLSYEEVKKLLLVTNYQGDDSKLLQRNGVPLERPREVRQLRIENEKVVEADAENYPEDVAIAKGLGKRRPKITAHAFQNLRVERVMAQSVWGVIQRGGGDPSLSLGDGIVFTEGDRKAILNEASFHVKCSYKTLPRDREELENAVQARAAMKGRSCSMTPQCTYIDIEALRGAHETLYESDKSRDDSAVADAVLPFVLSNFCESFVTTDAKGSKNVLQYWDDEQKRWIQEGGAERTGKGNSIYFF